MIAKGMEKEGRKGKGREGKSSAGAAAAVFSARGEWKQKNRGPAGAFAFRSFSHEQHTVYLFYHLKEKSQTVIAGGRLQTSKPCVRE
jgi:hypothetical protein